MTYISDLKWSRVLDSCKSSAFCTSENRTPYTISYSHYLANCANSNTNDYKQVTIVQHTMESDSYYKVHSIYINQKLYNQLPNTIITSLQYLYKTTTKLPYTTSPFLGYKHNTTIKSHQIRQDNLLA